MSDSISDGLPDRLLALAEDEIKGISAALSPANSMDLLAAADEISRLREAIRRLADQDATLSVLCTRDGSQVVTVTIDATLTPEEREAIGVALQCVESSRCQKHPEELAATVTLIRADATLRKLLERTS